MGNVLYLLLRAHTAQSEGRDHLVLDQFGPGPWRDAFPRLNELLLPPGQLAFTDRREHLGVTFFQAFGEDFTRPELQRFIADRLSDVDLDEVAQHASPRPRNHEVVINIRRGDYYSNPQFRRTFGFDIVDYVGNAWTELCEGGSPPSIAIVSDDPDWCRQHLRLPGVCQADTRYVGPADGILVSWATVARARELIITNSTFSYWAAYVAGHRHGAANRVWAPDFHARHVRQGAPWQHDPRWRRLAVRPEPGPGDVCS
ncbi:alpha-1,2-fucosyltransferase [Nocardioides litoris]|uniref:alpha-1,2-fucosyltransferase n=1 Tax=Nocardioides litoris TaxID=1926648 RepID=UPI001476BF31|nr:alpha-1,2-fucosyltransferase [Nocardioides litoris]